MIIKETSKIQQAWDNIAINFDKYVTPTANWALAKNALHLAGLQPGMHFLDVASGSGALSLPAARLGAEVLAVDISPVMIERLSVRAEEEGLSNLSGRVMDGHHLDLNDNTFDISGSQFGVMLFPDFQKGLNEMVRVTQPGGSVFLVAFGPMQKVEFIDMFTSAIREVKPDFIPFPPDVFPLPFQVSGEGTLEQKMKEAGLGNVQVKPIVHQLSFHSGQEMWNWVTSSNPIALQMIAGLDDQQRGLVVQHLEKMIQERSAGKEVATLEIAVNIGLGEKSKNSTL